jgi:hypothetical protein
MTTRSAMRVLMTLSLFFGVTSPVSADPQTAAKSHDASAERLKFMKESVEIYQLTLGGDRSTVLKLQEKPAFRLGKQYATDLEDGAIFLWTGADGRPEAAIQVFEIKDSQYPQGLWIHEFSSLSPATLTANRRGQARWTPRTPGVAFKPVPDAPRPAESVAQRTRQMRSMAAGFRASDDFKHKGWSELRLLPTPIARYGASGTKLIDGALFAFVLGTDPEVFLFLEVRPGKEGPEWQYAMAPMTIYPVKGSYKGKAVWELPDRDPSWDPSKPFFAKMYEP